ncbi:MAG: TlyA family RNA methyltransferase [Actinomycetota bacterium]|nr:TlyA family RNA methyltransferase [Actinomycetota bacterium]
MTRRRADVVIVERGLVASRERARAAIMAGEVRVGDEPVTKAGQLIDDNAEIEIRRHADYVSRGGQKLEGAFRVFGIDPRDARAVDVGASTGGFTDYLLQHGAEHVCAIDVGYGQLAWSLRQDPRVSVFERTNIRTAEPDDVGAPFDLAVVDVSFISVGKVLHKVCSMLRPGGQLVALVKPQFEAGKGRVGKRGVVREPAIHEEVLERVLGAVREEGLVPLGLTWSPITGPEGNIEFWIWASDDGEEVGVSVSEVVGAAHRELGR